MTLGAVRKIFSGYTEDTPKHLLLDSGAFFANYNVETDDFDKAVAAGKLIGATRSGGKFDAVPTVRQPPIDGVKGRAKGLEIIDAWEVSIGANVLEVTADTLVLALGAATIDTETDQKYDIVQGKNSIELEDYIDNITWIGTLSGSSEPVIIQILNALNTNGLSLQTQDQNEAVMAMTFYGHYNAGELDRPPFTIYYPKTKTEGV